MSWGPVVSHKKNSLFLPVNFFDTGSRQTKNRLPASGGGYRFTVEIFIRLPPHWAEITSSETFVPEKAPRRLHRPVAVPRVCGAAPDVSRSSLISTEGSQALRAVP